MYGFNELLKKLDIDPLVGDTDYFTSLALVNGGNARTQVNNLAIKLDADTGVSATDYASSLGGGSTFADIQTDFNIIIAKLNVDTGVKFNNYKTSSGTIDFEVIITAVDINTNTVTVLFNLPWIEGPIKIFKGIQTDVIWAPETFQDPSMMKQVREGTILFEQNNFSRAEVLYSSDLSPDFGLITFTGTGKGDWGAFTWSQQNWGGKGNAAPMRTYIPRDKQRCRYINCRFKHDSAREPFSIFGISFTFRPISEKAYRDI